MGTFSSSACTDAMHNVHIEAICLFKYINKMSSINMFVSWHFLEF